MPAVGTTERSAASRYLEDVKVGELIETDEFTVTRDMMVSLAEQYDPQPMHVDEAAARDTVFGEFVGSCWQTLLVTMRLIIESAPAGWNPYRRGRVSWRSRSWPMRPGDVLWASAKVVAIRLSKSRPARGLLDVKVTTKTSTGATLVTQTWSLVLPSGSAAAA